MRIKLPPMLLVVAAAGLPGPLLAASLTELAPPGPHFRLKPEAHRQAETFKAGQPIVGTTYFYWYDVYSGAHIRDPDGTDAMTDHPPTEAMADLSYKSARWHYTQLRDLCQARVDFIMPVYWGFPGSYEHWSVVGLFPLVAAHERMIAEHRQDSSNPLPPKIGMFYDTSTLRFNRPQGQDLGEGEAVDLTTPRGREWFYVTIRDFFSLIPTDKWARIDRRPIVFLYGASYAARVDDKLFPDTRRRFESDFGTGLFLVRHVDWPGAADATYQWGGAVALTLGDYVAGVGPGYDHSAVPGRTPLVVDRQQGRFYARQWETLLSMNPARRPWIVHVETWNEWHEGTDVARSQEYGDQYIKATADYADRFRAGVRLERSGPFRNAERVRWSGDAVGGLDLLPSKGDGLWTYRQVDGVRAVLSTPSEDPSFGRYLYFNIDDSYAFDESERQAGVTVVFRDDGGCGSFGIEYDNGDMTIGPRGGAFRSAPQSVAVGNTGTWRTAELRLENVRFINRANGADFRLVVGGGPGQLTVREVIVRLLPGTPLSTRPP